MREGYERLFAAIYKRAVVDDILTVCSATQRALISQGMDRRKAIGYVNGRKDYIKERVQKYVYEESQEWGEGTTKAIQVREMNALIEELVKEGA